MTIQEVHPIASHLVVTDEKPWNVYTRYGPDSWMQRMGESYEPVYECAELEAAFQAFIATSAKAPSSAPTGSALRRGRPKDALAFIDHVRIASHVEVAHRLGISPWKASTVCNQLHKRGLISCEQRGGRGPNARPSIWHTKTNI